MSANAHLNGRRTEEAHLRTLWNVIQRNRWVALGVPVLVLAATVGFVLTATPIYEATTSLQVDEQGTSVPVLDALKSLSSGGSKIDTDMEVLHSRTLAEQAVDSLGLALSVRAPRRVARTALFSLVRVSRQAPAGEYVLQREGERFRVVDGATGRTLGSAAPGETVQLPGATLTLASGAAAHARIELRVQPFERAVRAFRQTLDVSRPNRQADVVVLRYEGPDPQLVRDVPNVLAAEFMTRRQLGQQSQALSTVAFLRSQIDTLSRQLGVAEDALRRFRERNRVVAPDEQAKAEVGRLVDLQAQRDLAEAERSALADLMAQTESAAAGTGGPSPLRRLIAFPTLLKNPAATEMLRSLNEAEDRRAELLDRRKPEDPDVQVLTNRIQQLDAQLGGIVATYLRGLQNQIASYDSILQRFGSTLDRIPATEVEYARLLRQEKVLAEIYTMLQTRLKEAQIMAAVVDPSVRVVDPAIVPDQPIRPNVPLSLGLGLFLGIVLGVGLAFGREHLDTTVRSRDDLLSAGGDVPVLGTIPRIQLEAAANGDRWRRAFRRRAPLPVGAPQERLVAMRDPRSPISEAYRSLRTNITFARPERVPSTIVFTSPGPGEGKSTSTANLAATLAQQGLRCLLVDADMRRGALHQALRARQEPGLSDLVVGRADLANALQHVELDEGVSFDFLAAGTLPPNPAELLGSVRMAELLARLGSQYDTVLLDAPPLNLVTDAAVLGTKADGVIVVARAGVTDRGALHYAFEQLQAVRAPVLGSILNDLDQRQGRYYGAYGPGGYVRYATE